MRCVLAIAVVAALTACQSPGVGQGAVSPGSSPSRAPSSAPPSGLVLAVLLGPIWDSSTLDLVDRTGKVLASTPVSLPARPPAFTNAANLADFRPLVVVAGQGVYWADSTGAIQRLGRDGKISQITRFPLGQSQQLTFAVSPDETQLMASILTIPPCTSTAPGPCQRDASAVWTMQTMSASAGGAAHEVASATYHGDPPAPTQVVGWDQRGALATVNTVLARQDAPLSERYEGQLIHLGGDGSHLDAIGGPDCAPLDSLPDGTVLCAKGFGGPFTVRSGAGETLWQLSVDAGSYLSNPALAPDGSRVADYGSGKVFARTAATRSLPAWTTKMWDRVSWVDAHTVAYSGTSGHLVLANLDDQSTGPADLGFSGHLVGTLG